jgi:hypothetical protein
MRRVASRKLVSQLVLQPEIVMLLVRGGSGRG